MSRKPAGYEYPFEDGSWMHLPWKHIWHLACCDCGLVHDVHRALVRHGNGSKLFIKIERNEKETNAFRAAKKKRK